MDPRVVSLHHISTDVARDAGIGAAGSPAVSQQQVDRFQALLAEGTPHAPVQAPGESGSLIGKAIAEQAEQYRNVPNDLMYSIHHMSELSMQRLMAVDMTLQLEVASLNSDLQVKMATVQSSKESVQTLMKNQ
jgi:type III secretion inner rod protein HrpB2